MWKLSAIIMAVLVSVAAVPIQGGPTTGSSNEALILAEDLVNQVGWIQPNVMLEPADTVSGEIPFAGKILDVEREVIVGDIAHYRVEIRIGYGQHDVINLHRVVKEERPYRPIRTEDNVFLLHGDAVGFVKFLFGAAAPSVPDDHAAAVYLAQNDVDVWGMDQDWILVPPETTDFTFMENWGLQHQVDNLALALDIARQTRHLTGSKRGKMNVLGYSSGAFTIYALANQESQIPRGHRLVGGLIPADIHYKYDPADLAGIQVACAFAEDSQLLHDSGTYADESGLLFQTLGYLARVAPDDPSPVVPGLTNMQASLFFVAATYQLLPFTPSWHYMGGTFDEYGLPDGLEYTTIEGMLDFLDTASPFEPLQFPIDYAVILCDEEDVPFDDHLADITVPVLYLGPAGGIGETGVYATTLLGGDDITVVIPQLRPDEEILLDIGHIDMWTAEEADELVWAPLLDWLKSHTPKP